MIEIPQGWWKVDSAGWVITNGVDEMEYVPGLGYVM